MKACAIVLAHLPAALGQTLATKNPFTGEAITGVEWDGEPFTGPKTPHPRDGMVPVTAVRDLGEGITDGPKKMCFGLCGGGANGGLGPCHHRDWGEELCGGRSGPPTRHGRTWVETMTVDELGDSIVYGEPGVGPLGGTAVPCPKVTCEAWGIPCDDCFEPEVMVHSTAAVVARTDHTCKQPVTPIAVTPPSTSADEYPSDVAIWRDAANPSASVIFATDRGGRRRNPGHVWAFDLSGSLKYTVNVSHPYHVDVEYGLSIGGETRDILVTCERDERKLRVWAVGPDGSLTSADGCTTLDGGDCGIPIFDGEEASTSCTNVQMYKRETDGAIFAIVARDQGRGEYHRSQRARSGYYTGASFTPYNFATPAPMTLTLDGTDLDISVSGDMQDPEAAASLLQDAIDQTALISVIETADIYGTITFTKNAQGTVDVRANLIWTDESWPVTTTGHNWHIHANSLEGVVIGGVGHGGGCNCDNEDDILDCTQEECPQCWEAGGHYDPAGLEADAQGNLLPGYSCNPSSQTTCYAGDLSGKFGPLRITANPERENPPPRDPDTVGTDLVLDMADLKGKSIVIHAGDMFFAEDHVTPAPNDRIACGRIESAATVTVDDGGERHPHDPVLRIDSKSAGASSMVDVPAGANARNTNIRALFGTGESTAGSDYVPSYRDPVPSLAEAESFVWQYQLQDFDADGVVQADKVREFGTIEAKDVAVDDQSGVIYMIGYDTVMQVPADPDAFTGTVSSATAKFGGEGVFERYRSGGSVWVARGEAKKADADNAGYILIGDMRNNSVHAFCRGDNDVPPPTAEAVFDSAGLSGKVIFTAALDGVEVYASVKHSSGSAEATTGHNWQIVDGTPGGRNNDDCSTVVGQVWGADPEGLAAMGYHCDWTEYAGTSGSYQYQDQSSCFLGDMSGKFGRMDIPERGDGDARYRPAPPITGVDTTVGVESLLGKSIVIMDEDGETPLACAALNEGIPDASTYAGNVRLDGVTESSGQEVSSEDFGGDLDQGILVTMSENTHNFYIYNWKDVGACLEMDVCGVKALPRAADSSAPTEDGGGGMTVVLVLLVAGAAAAAFKLKGQGSKKHTGESMYADDSDLALKMDSPA